jgi:uncharacterized membrane protein YkoI
MRHPITLLIPLLVCGLASADQERASELLRQGRILSLETILEQQQRLRPGRVLEVELEEEDGRLIYEIEVLDEKGRVWELLYDATNAELLGQGRED